jgi:3-methyladenine DNA glycosylase AlkD
VVQPADATAEIRSRLKAVGNPARAISEANYLKSTIHHFGASVPAVRQVAKQWLREHPGTIHDDVVAVCNGLWAEPVHEMRLATVELVLARPKLLGPADLPWLEQLLRECGTWALLDALASDGVGRIVRDQPAAAATLDRWLTDDDFWIRRSAVLALRPSLRVGTQTDRFLRYADTLLPEREFFIRKAIGWVAREEGSRNPDVISDWVRENMSGMNMVTLREAVKYLPDGHELLAEYRQSRRRNSSG